MGCEYVNAWRSVSNSGAATGLTCQPPDGTLQKRLWQQVSSIQQTVCHSCQSPDRDLSTLSSLVRQTGQWTRTHTHTDANNTTSRLVRADDNWLAGWQESVCLGYELVSPPTLSLCLILSVSHPSLPPSFPSLSGVCLFPRICPAVSTHYASPGVLLPFVCLMETENCISESSFCVTCLHAFYCPFFPPTYVCYIIILINLSASVCVFSVCVCYRLPRCTVNW